MCVCVCVCVRACGGGEGLESGKKTTAVDERYFYLAEEQLYGELSYVLGKTKEEILKEICWE